MAGIVLGNTLRSAWKQILYWGCGMGLLGVYIVFIGSDADIVQGYASLFESMPPAMLQAFGASSLELFSSTEGWFVSIFVSEVIIFLSIFAVMAGLNITANDENSGNLDVLLSLPISRATFLMERWIAYALLGLGILLFTAALTLGAMALFSPAADTGVVLLSMLNLYPGTLLVMTVTCLLAAVLRRRAVAIALAAAFVVASFLFNLIGAAASGAIADLMQQLSYFSHAGGEDIVLGTHDPAGAGALLIIVAIGFLVSVKMFDSRDIGL